MVTAGTFGRGALNGLKTTGMLLKIVLPVYVLVSLLGRTPVIARISRLFEPVILAAGLPGDAVLAFIKGSAIFVISSYKELILMNFASTILSYIQRCRKYMFQGDIASAPGQC